MKGITHLAAGALSHILLDCLNPGGAMLWYPFSKRHHRFFRIGIGSLKEYLLMPVLYAAAYAVLRFV